MFSHQYSLGNMYAFGHQCVFKTLKNSTVGLYEVKKIFKENRQLELEQMATQIEDIIHVKIFIAKDKL